MNMKDIVLETTPVEKGSETSVIQVKTALLATQEPMCV